MTNAIEANGPIYNGPGASRPNSPFTLRNLETSQKTAIERAKKYAMEQSIRSVLIRQTQSQQTLQLNSIKKSQTIALLNRVYVGSIAYDVREDTLQHAFSPFGPVKSASLSWDPTTQKHKGFAFIEFECPESAQMGIEQMNGTSFGGRQLKVGRPSNLTNPEPIILELINEHKLSNRIFVAGIHLDLTEDDVSLVFEAFGKIVFCNLPPDPSKSEGHRGYGYVEYESFQCASDAIASMNLFNLGGQLLRVCRAISPLEGYSNANTSNLPPAAAVAAASVTAQLLSLETQQLVLNPETIPQTSMQNGKFSNDENGTTKLDSKSNSSSSRKCGSTTKCIASSVLVLRNVVNPEDCDSELEGEIFAECSKYGSVQKVLIDQIYDSKEQKQVVNIFVAFIEEESTTKAISSLNNRYFAGRQIIAEPYDRDAFVTNNLSL